MIGSIPRELGADGPVGPGFGRLSGAGAVDAILLRHLQLAAFGHAALDGAEAVVFLAGAGAALARELVKAALVLGAVADQLELHRLGVARVRGAAVVGEEQEREAVPLP